VAARWTSYASEALSKLPALEVGAQLALDVFGKRSRVRLTRVTQEHFEVLAHDAEKDGLLRIAPLVLGVLFPVDGCVRRQAELRRGWV
jgi:hypothetical protein